MPIVLNGSTGITTPTYNGSTTAEYLVPVTGFKNRIINGDMGIAQRGTSLTNPNGYTLDRWFVATGVASTVIQQSSNVPTGAGFSSSLFYNQGASTWTPTGVQWNSLAQSIEGFNTADLMWGTANAQTVTLSFWVRASLTGTYSVALNNATTTDIGSATVGRSYVSTFTVSAADTWQQVSITIAGDTSGTWLTTNGAGLSVVFSLGNASGYNTATTNAWQTGKFLQTSGSVSLATNANSTFYITGVQLEKGSNATSFDYLPYGTELQLCQRYYQKSYNISTVAGTATDVGAIENGVGASVPTTSSIEGSTTFKVSMRTSPTVTAYDRAGNSGRASRVSPGVSSTNNQTANITFLGENGFGIEGSGVSAVTFIYHYQATAEL
jgi:hypothetical protein